MKIKHLFNHLWKRGIFQIVVFDFETYWDSEYSLDKMPTIDYIRDVNFDIHMLGIIVIDISPDVIKDKGKPFVAHKRVLNKVETDSFLKSDKFNWRRSAVLAHNTKFDWLIISEHYGKKAGFYLDSLSMGFALHGGDVGGSLAKLSEHYEVGEKIGDGKGGKFINSSRGVRELNYTEYTNMAEYCLMDTELCWKIFCKMLHQLPWSQIQIIDITIRMVVDQYFMVEDLDGFHKYVQGLRDETKRQVIEAFKDAGVNVTSYEMACDALRSRETFAQMIDKLGAPIPYKLNKKGDVTYAFAKTDPGMQELLDHDDLRIQAMAAAKLKIGSTNEEKKATRFLYTANTGRLPVPLKVWGAHTGRFGGEDKYNWQNIGRGSQIKQFLTAPPGYVFCERDSSQVQARITAWLADQMDLVKLFRINDAGGPDVYCTFGSTYIYSREITKQDFVERFISKQAVLGLGFQMGWKKFRDQCIALASVMGIEVPHEDDLYKKATFSYRRAYDQIVALWAVMEDLFDAIVREERKEYRDGLLVTTPQGILLPNGMTIKYPRATAATNQDGRKFFHRNKPEFTYGGKLTENIVQAFEQVLVQGWMIKMHNAGMPVVLQSHDAITVCVPEKVADQALKVMGEIMGEGESWCKDLPLNSEGGYARIYSEVEKA